MSERANLFIPQCDGSESVLEHVCRRFSEEYGGATVRRDHEGYWVDDDGDLVEDTVDVVFRYDSEIDRETLRDLAEHVKQELDEDAVLTSVESADTMMI
ncbi:hypothetical protein PN419_00420 [Halorubrum ezzemoulense]|uniref:hypothetical protein n=1 Tax=Halorubrum ezzemoulense TaxID=337243 RepID=UPI00232EE95A|nr:hypothetical protein [Halorubrum ezzemoulense]MDB9247471.1 hypothetical protein [Halorubrum ezzemoulense]MDB9258620.1 hypothetical protein [Halorubrum ezzemoulense]MDB9264522.1 hypothetical protein [Halorubrum ezzemoulense]MDB9268981.1 hypothetical protein [Halorubrum ezzemoulense]MDB9271490.1 hypothetical protein [Halorubrum ezzemoulense]